MPCIAPPARVFMSVEKLQSVLWRLRKRIHGKDVCSWIDLKRAIMWECGTDPKTIQSNLDALVTLGWVVVDWESERVELTGNDLNEA